MGLGVAPREEQHDGKAKRQKVSARTEETLFKKEVRSKRRNDHAEKGKKVEAPKKGEEKMPEKVKEASNKSEKSDSSNEKTVSSNKSDSAHSISKGSKAPLTKVYTRSRTSGSKGKLIIKDLVVTGTLMEMFNRVSAQWKDSSKKDEEEIVEGTEVIHSESSGERTVELKEVDEGIEIDPDSSMVDKLQAKQQAGVLEEVQVTAAEGQNPEKGEESSCEKDHASEHGHLADDELSQGADGISLTQIQPSSPQGELLGSTSSPTIQTPIPPIFHETMPTMPPFSPSLHLPQTHIPLKPQPLSFAPPTEPSPIPTISRETSHNLDSLIAAIDLGTTNLTPLKTTNTITTSNLNQFLNLNQTPQTESPQPIYPATIHQHIPFDMPSHFGSLDSSFAAFGEPSGTAQEKEAPEKDAAATKSSRESPKSSEQLEQRMTKMEKMMKRIKELLKNVLEGQAIIQQGQRAQVARDERYREWVMQTTNRQSPNLGPFEHIPDIPRPATSTSSDGSSPSK